MTRLFSKESGIFWGREVGRGKREGGRMREAGFEDPLYNPAILVLTDIEHFLG